MKVNDIIQDGSAEFKVLGLNVESLLNLVYPIGCIFTTITSSPPPFGSWVEVGSGRVLMGGNNTDTTVEAGLPNIKGKVGQGYKSNGTINGGWHNHSNKGYGSGALYLDGTSNGSSCTWNTYSDAGSIAFDASKSNSIYGKSSTVQPPAYIVHFYKRVS